MVFSGKYKDPYHFDFLGLEDNAQEREIEQALTRRIMDFILELEKDLPLYRKSFQII